MRAAFRLRLRLILGALTLVALLILARLYFVQVVHGADYALKADRQYESASSGLFDRGSIYFTDKDGTQVSAATLGTGFLVAVNPQTLKDPEAAYEAVNAAAPAALDKDAFLSLAGNTGAVYVEVAHHLTDAAGKALAAKDIPGIEVLRERWRTYPGGTLAAQTIGFVAQSATDDTLRGRTGLEASYEGTLSRSGDSLYQNFFAEIFSNVGNALASAEDAREGDIVTTLEPEVETRLVNDLAKVNTQYSSKESGGIIMDPKTGAIIAMASFPTYDPNDLAHADPSTLQNPLVEHVYEFGSIMKALTVASGLDAGVITPSSTYDDTGCITVDTKRVCNYDLKARGVIPVQQILSQSLNVGASWIATELGQDSFRDYFTKLFGQKTGVDLPGEVDGLTGNLQSSEQINFDNMSFGQGIAVTPIQMIRALGALANGGAVVEPHLVSAVKLDSGITKPLDWSGKTQVFSPQAVQETTAMLVNVADYALANGADRIPTLSFAAKTGTAQLTMPGGGYYSNRFFHSFFGYFPASNPRFIILLYTDDPQGVEYASETLTSTFMDLTHFLIDYYQIPPDRAAPTAL